MGLALGYGGHGHIMYLGKAIMHLKKTLWILIACLEYLVSRN
jgi:hypothetical protein